MRASRTRSSHGSFHTCCTAWTPAREIGSVTVGAVGIVTETTSSSRAHIAPADDAVDNLDDRFERVRPSGAG